MIVVYVNYVVNKAKKLNTKNRKNQNSKKSNLNALVQTFSTKFEMSTVLRYFQFGFCHFQSILFDFQFVLENFFLRFP